MDNQVNLIADQDYTIILTGAELAIVVNKVVDMPYKEVATTITKMTEQIEQQNLKTKENGQ